MADDIKNIERTSRRNKKSDFILNLGIVFSLVIAGALLYILISQRFVINELKQTSKALEVQRIELQVKIKDLNKQIEEVNSLDYIEKVAREKLGMIKSGETIYLESTKESLDETSDETSNESSEDLIESKEESFEDTTSENSN